jgi:hypothetical protein
VLRMAALAVLRMAVAAGLAVAAGHRRSAQAGTCFARAALVVAGPARSPDWHRPVWRSLERSRHLVFLAEALPVGVALFQDPGAPSWSICLRLARVVPLRSRCSGLLSQATQLCI